MTGTFINVAGIILGSLIGLLIKKGIPEHINESVLKVQGLAIAIIGLTGVLGAMFKVNADGTLSDSGGLLLLVSLVLGCVCGELLKIDARINDFGLWVEKKTNAGGFSRGFVTATLIFSIGTMAIIGPINDALTGDLSILLIKTMLDGTTSIVLAASLGFGVLFAFIPVFVVQSVPALLARQLAPFISPELLSIFRMVGFAIVICIGLNFLVDAKIKTANLLPALVVPIVYYFIFL